MTAAVVQAHQNRERLVAQLRDVSRRNSARISRSSWDRPRAEHVVRLADACGDCRTSERIDNDFDDQSEVNRLDAARSVDRAEEDGIGHSRPCRREIAQIPAQVGCGGLRRKVVDGLGLTQHLTFLLLN
jgi:hypothetical protein